MLKLRIGWPQTPLFGTITCTLSSVTSSVQNSDSGGGDPGRYSCAGWPASAFLIGADDEVAFAHLCTRDA